MCTPSCCVPSSPPALVWKWRPGHYMCAFSRSIKTNASVFVCLVFSCEYLYWMTWRRSIQDTLRCVQFRLKGSILQVFSCALVDSTAVCCADDGKNLHSNLWTHASHQSRSLFAVTLPKVFTEEDYFFWRIFLRAKAAAVSYTTNWRTGESKWTSSSFPCSSGADVMGDEDRWIIVTWFQEAQ